MTTKHILGLAAAALFAMGCSNTVRELTAVKWVSLGAGGGGASAPPVAAAAPAEGAAPAPAPAPAAGGGGADGRILYVTYWEGSCSGGFAGMGQGCSRGDAKIKRCNVKTDNSLECHDEAVANKAFSADQ